MVHNPRGRQEIGDGREHGRAAPALLPSIPRWVSWGADALQLNILRSQRLGRLGDGEWLAPCDDLLPWGGAESPVGSNESKLIGPWLLRCWKLPLIETLDHRSDHVIRDC